MTALASPVSPHPIGEALPGMFADDDFVQRWCQGLDDVLAPALVILDCLDAYVDPRVAPPDFVAWLAGWMGLGVEEGWPLGRLRELVATAAALYQWQGTARGVADHVELLTGVRPEVVDSGGVAWSEQPDGPLPGSPEASIVVRVGGSADLSAVEAAVAGAKPAHVSHRVEAQ